MRKILGTLAGIAAAIATVFVVEGIGHAMFPPPAGTDLSDSSAMASLMDHVPLGAKIAVVTAWFLGSLIGAWTAATLARWRWAGWIVVALIVAGGIATLIQIPHPLGMQVSAIALPLIAGWLALRLVRSDPARAA